MDVETKPCVKCGHLTVNQRDYKTLPTPRAYRVRVVATGECKTCWRQGHVPADRIEKVSQEMVLVDWRWLHETGELTEDMSLVLRVKVAAPRMGMTFDALQNALLRAGVRNPVETIPAIVTDSGCRRCGRLRAEVAVVEVDVCRVARSLGESDTPAMRKALARSKDKRARVRESFTQHRAEHGAQAAA